MKSDFLHISAGIYTNTPSISKDNFNNTNIPPTYCELLSLLHV